MEDIEIVYKVSEINEAIKEIVSSSFNNIWVEGEISGLKESSLNHIYFDLKDEFSIISCVVFKWNVRNVDFELKNGLLVRVLADLTIYEKQSKYQLIIKKILPIATGKLQLEFEKLKKKLQEEGLFDVSRKKKIPPFPRKVGVITSLYGAALRDIISIIKRRAPNIDIIIYPVKVQGEGAKEEIANAIAEMNHYFYGLIDVLLVGRGGGSMEDLWAFNEEIVARAIAGSKIPIISCVGHQTDFTIADFVADLRAPTPSAAAEIVSKNIEDVVNYVKQIEKRLISSLKIIYHRIYNRFSVFVGSRFYKNPIILIENSAIMLDELYERLNMAINEKIKNMINALDNLNGRLKNLDPHFPTKKGYTIAFKKNTVIKSIKNLNIGDEVELLFSDGRVFSIIKEIKTKENL